MYSHLRNDFILSLTKNFNTSEITMILASLDRNAHKKYIV